MKIILRKDAQALGLKRYFTGKLCKYGHVAERFMNGTCMACRAAHYAANKEGVRAYNAAYCKANQERVATTKAAWAKRNPERRRAAEAAYKTRNPSKVAARKAVYRAANREKIAAHLAAYYVANKEKWAAYRKDNPGKRNATQAKRASAKLQRTPSWANPKKIERIYELAAWLSRFTGIRYEIDHVIPLQGKFISGLHVETNLQILTKSANSSKGNRVALPVGVRYE